MFRTVAILASALSLAALSACHTTRGGWMPFTGGSNTYYSTETSPKSVRLVDLRTNETLFQMDIPVGQQLSLDFQKDEGDDPVNTPDLMRYQLMDLGTQTGRLRNSLTVPGAASRRLEMWVRTGPEMAPTPPTEALRVDQQNRPAHWTPQGGPMPEKSKAEMYDG